MKYVITGGAGFIGSNIVHELVRRGDEVVVVDNLVNGDKKNLDDVMDKIRFIFDDITNMSVCRKACDKADFVLHQAALGSVPRSLIDPIMTNEHNVSGTINMLVAARDANVRAFIYAGSSSVYGDTSILPKIETMPHKPLSPYAVSKVACEEYVKTFFRNYNMPTVIFRYFNVFGPRQSSKGPYAAVIPKFIDAAINNKSAVIYGDGKQTRDFTFVQDVVLANIHAAKIAGSISGEIFNIGGGSFISINDLYNIIYSIVGCNKKPEYQEKRKGDIRKSLASINKANRYLEFQPYKLINLRDCLSLTVEWFRNA